jgi:LmbE family N-acetylglucosaminyl deacetylase
MKKYLLLFILLFIPLVAKANVAANLTKSSSYYIGASATTDFKDNNYNTYQTINSIKIESINPIKHVYIIYGIKTAKGALKTDSETIELGKNDFLHEYVKLNMSSKSITLNYNQNVTISEIHVYGEGDIPADVQIWGRDETTDLMIFSTHSDDEVLFFGGIIPTYINQGKKVHVTYLTKHYDCKKPNQIRLHEVLDGLWTSGVRDYPTFGILPDEGSRITKKNSKGLNKIIKKVKKQVKADRLSDAKIIDFYVRVIRQYKPKVILGHDVYGEYGHGQHIYNTYILKQAVKKARTKRYKISGLAAYKVPKVYLHLYGKKKNRTTINLDVPLIKYNNKTAYQVTQEAFKKHVSQQKSKYPAWLNGNNNEYTRASQIKTSSPMYWGLYYTSVGKDKKKNDLFEHIV